MQWVPTERGRGAPPLAGAARPPPGALGAAPHLLGVRHVAADAVHHHLPRACLVLLLLVPRRLRAAPPLAAAPGAPPPQRAQRGDLGPELRRRGRRGRRAAAGEHDGVALQQRLARERLAQAPGAAGDDEREAAGGRPPEAHGRVAVERGEDAAQARAREGGRPQGVLQALGGGGWGRVACVRMGGRAVRGAAAGGVTSGPAWRAAMLRGRPRGAGCDQSRRSAARTGGAWRSGPPGPAPPPASRTGRAGRRQISARSPAGRPPATLVVAESAHEENSTMPRCWVRWAPGSRQLPLPGAVALVVGRREGGGARAPGRGRVCALEEAPRIGGVGKR
jgi:hypothetical protein